jgi:hypothetical protein
MSNRHSAGRPVSHWAKQSSEFIASFCLFLRVFCAFRGYPPPRTTRIMPRGWRGNTTDRIPRKRTIKFHSSSVVLPRHPWVSVIWSVPEISQRLMPCIFRPYSYPLISAAIIRCSTPTGLVFVFRTVPKALPWAVLFQPFRLGTRARRHACCWLSSDAFHYAASRFATRAKKDGL